MTAALTDFAGGLAVGAIGAIIAVACFRPYAVGMLIQWALS